jgi:hypothetical protein
MDEPSSGVPATGPADPAAAPIVLHQSRLQRDGLFGALIAVFLVALVRGYTGAQTTTGRVVLVVFVSVVTAALAVGWVRLIRRPCRLEISSQTITFVGGKGATRVLSRRSGDELKLVSLGSGRYRQYGLTIQGADTVLPLPFFSAKQVKRQCRAAGWSFPARR